MLLSTLVAASEAVAATASRREKVARLAELLGALGPGEVEPAIGFLIGWPRQGKVGLGWAGYQKAASGAGDPPAEPSIALAEVDEALDRIGAMTGKGSAAARRTILRDVLTRATESERRFLGAVVVGEVRQGALEGVLLDAVAKAAGVPAARVQRAVMLAGDLGRVAHELSVEGPASLDRHRIVLFRPLLPMLADTAADVGDALARLGRAALEYKFDGARIQVHKDGSEIRVYSRSQNDVTDAVPDVVERVRSFPVRRAILDGEAIALDPAGRPHPFQVTMRRFGRRLDVDALRRELPLASVFFDAILIDDQELLDRPQAERFARLAAAVPEEAVVPSLVTADPVEAGAFFARALAEGHEGLMAKATAAVYDAGRRGGAWLKVKPAVTLDLVVLAAEWGHGRRKGWLSNLHLGARDPAGGPCVMLGKTFKGMTDEILAWQTEQLLAREERRDGHTVYVRPELVVEVAFDGIQASPQYPGGVALRFARIKGYRPDKRAAEADTIDTVRALANGLRAP